MNRRITLSTIGLCSVFIVPISMQSAEASSAAKITAPKGSIIIDPPVVRPNQVSLPSIPSSKEVLQVVRQAAVAVNQAGAGQTMVVRSLTARAIQSVGVISSLALFFGF